MSKSADMPRLQWLARNIGPVRKYAGQWIAIGDHGLLAHSYDLQGVIDLAVEAGEPDPLVHYVPLLGSDFGF